jgi:CRISPR/Cas system-associated exonuclease Cas4 (RecB family)
MTLPLSFQFSQGSLQDYVDCARRFQLRYVRRLRWPAIEVAPALENERHLQQGSAFHRLIHRHLVGLPVKKLSEGVADPELRRWWRNYLESGPEDLPAHHHPEVGLSAPLGNFRLVAQYDLVAVDVGDRAVIVDWKTNRRRPTRAGLAERLQTHVYPYLLVRAGALLNRGEEIRPQHVAMVYWFANFPANPERFSYDDDQYRADHDRLTRLVVEIEHMFEDGADEDLLPRATDERRCRYCRYRSLCRRGVEAGSLDEVASQPMVEDADELELDFEFSFEQIAETDYG